MGEAGGIGSVLAFIKTKLVYSIKPDADIDDRADRKGGK